jgi:hypothetical protein
MATLEGFRIRSFSPDLRFRQLSYLVIDEEEIPRGKEPRLAVVRRSDKAIGEIKVYSEDRTTRSRLASVGRSGPQFARFSLK